MNAPWKIPQSMLRRARCAKTLQNRIRLANKVTSQFDKFFARAPFVDAYDKIYINPRVPMPAPKPLEKVSLSLPQDESSADPLVSLLANAIEMQNKQSEELKAAQAEAEAARHDIVKSMGKTVKQQSLTRRQQLKFFEQELKRKSVADRQALQKFSAHQSDFIRECLRKHTEGEKVRLEEYRKISEEARQEEAVREDRRFQRTLSAVEEQVKQHTSCLSTMRSRLSEQRDGERALSRALNKGAAAVANYTSANEKGVLKAIGAMAADVRAANMKNTQLLTTAVGQKADYVRQGIKHLTQQQGEKGKKYIVAAFKRGQKDQLKGLQVAVMHQKKQQQQQLVGLRDALEAKRRASGIPQAPAGSIQRLTASSSKPKLVTKG